MAEKFVVESAKSSKDLDKAYEKVKGSIKDYGFTSLTNLKTEVVKKAMDESKKGADFVAEYDFVNNAMIGQLVCDVKGKMRSVIGRSEIKSVDEAKKFKKLVENKGMMKNFEQMGH